MDNTDAASFPRLLRSYKGLVIRFASTSLMLLGFFLQVPLTCAEQSAYVNTQECAACHARIFASYQLTGMARSFYPATPGPTIEDFYHAPSDTHYSMFQRQGKYYQRRWQIGPDGRPINEEELGVDFVMGSGNHARTYLHRTARGTLLELPLGWYSEKGGFVAMNPGYDTPHPPSHRPVAYECMFCHNSYPQIPTGHGSYGSEPVFTGSLPQGIDCQRCHGAGAKHVQTARATGASLQAIRAAIVNPARLSKDRQMEVCLQCHLETTSTRLPSLIRRFYRAPFSYVPGQPLGAFVISFDHAPGSGHDDKFEIAGAAYRLRKSKCFVLSKGEMTCETCHNPHDIPRGPAATTYYSGICSGCHATSLARLASAGTHPPGNDCISCHMPKRRTEDAVHVVVTDHLIQRRPPARDLLAELPESHPTPQDEYRGPVIPYYPSPLPSTPENALYLAAAQVQNEANLTNGITQLREALAKAQSPGSDFYMALGDALHFAGEPGKAVDAYEAALRKQPDSSRAQRYLGIALMEAGQPERAAEVLERETARGQCDAQALFELGLLLSNGKRIFDALTVLKKSIACNPDLPDVWNSLAINLGFGGNQPAAESALHESLRIDPYYASAQSNLASLLSARSDFAGALYYFEKAAHLQPNGANLYNYALALVRLNRFDDARKQVSVALQADANLAEAHELLGGLLARNKEMDLALVEYRKAVELKPDFGRAQLDLALTLAATGQMREATVHLREAAKSNDTVIAEQAASALRKIGASQ
jgi:tetratricopeptide (TPR) repeat protein